MTLMTSFPRAAALVACLLPLVALAQYSTPMRNVDNPDRFPYQESTSTSMDPPYLNGFGFLPTPPGKRYVIEFVSVYCSTPSAADTFPQAYLVVTKVLSATSTMSSSVMLAPLVRTGSGAFGGYIWTSQTPVKLYSDPNPFNADGSNALYLNLFHTDTSVRASCSTTVSGHTVTP